MAAGSVRASAATAPEEAAPAEAKNNLLDIHDSCKGKYWILKQWASHKNPRFQKEIAAAEDRLKRRGKLPPTPSRVERPHQRRKPCERGGRVSIALPFRILAPGAPPPLPAMKFLERCGPKAHLCMGGAHAFEWGRVAKGHKEARARINLDEVAHDKGEQPRQYTNVAATTTRSRVHRARISVGDGSKPTFRTN